MLTDSLELPDGSRVRGRGLRHPLPEGPRPEYGLYLGSRRLRARHDAGLSWPHTWLAWPDFLLPLDRAAAIAAITDLHRRALAGEAVEVACNGGVGRTGTVLSCLVVLTGADPDAAIAWVRARHDPHAVETPWQRRWVRAFPR